MGDFINIKEWIENNHGYAASLHINEAGPLSMMDLSRGPYKARRNATASGPALNRVYHLLLFNPSLPFILT
jgi:hypothetical protein